MALFGDTYSDIANSFNSWCESSPTGGEYVTDLALEYANRAQDSLLLEAPRGWDYLTKTYQLTVSSLLASLPSDYGVMIQVFADTDNDGKPDFYYYKDGELIEGFKFTDAFTKAAGHSFGLQFYQAPMEPLYAMYQARLESFTGTGTEYSFFPKNLLLRKMQHQRCIDKGLLQESNAILLDLTTELNRFKDQHQNVAEPMSLQINDARGRQIFVPKYSVLSGGNVGGRIIGKTNDQDMYRR